MNRKLVLENGLVFEGEGFGSNNDAVSRIVFNTSVVGYQEILSDPACFGQMVCMTYPVIGSYGLTDEDYESKGITASAVICREYNDEPSNFRYTHKLGEVMDEQGIPGICNVDTREIARVIRDNGTMKALITNYDTPIDECMEIINSYIEPDNLAYMVSSKKVWHSRTTNPLFTVVCVDCGVKKSVIKQLNNISSNVVVVPMDTTVEEIMKHKPTGLLISDGPGNPNNLAHVVELIKECKDKLPILGIGMGMDLIALAFNARVDILKVGHHGCNLPVRSLKSNKIEITAQNHLYEVARESIKNGLKITHENVIDNTVMGISSISDSIIAIKYNPSDDIKNEENIYNRFARLMKSFGGNKNAKKNRY